uniref:Stealth protein CR1 conserved region 1 domain-containing protein n=1 Tax=Mycena chlorophos TaxID=658473 RepID=A0ABQ0L750_MYCCL|nr:predicted protein [Mycena chlorophos]
MATTTTDAPSSIFPSAGTQALSSLINHIGLTILTFFLTRRVFSEESRGGRGPRLCVLLVFLDSYLFLLSSGILVFGVGLQINTTACAAAIFLCVLFYASSKALIYIFLAERVYIVWGGGRPRLKCVTYMVCIVSVTMYMAVVLAMILYRIAEFRESDGVCIIGLERAASIPLLMYDLYINILLTALFIWPILRSRHKAAPLKRVARRTLIASGVALTTSTINIAVLTILHGRELGWVCLASCGADVVCNAGALFWVTGPGSGHTGDAADSDFDADLDRDAPAHGQRQKPKQRTRNELNTVTEVTAPSQPFSPAGEAIFSTVITSSMGDFDFETSRVSGRGVERNTRDSSVNGVKSVGALFPGMRELSRKERRMRMQDAQMSDVVRTPASPTLTEFPEPPEELSDVNDVAGTLGLDRTEVVEQGGMDGCCNERQRAADLQSRRDGPDENRRPIASGTRDGGRQTALRLLPMSSREAYLYEPLGSQPRPKSRWRELMCSPTRWTAVLIIVVLSLSSIALLTLQTTWQWPWKSSSVVPKIFPTTDDISIPHGAEGPAPYPPALQDAKQLGQTVYHPFVAPLPAQAIADTRVRPIRAQLELSDACLDRWVSSGQWTDPCTRAMVSESKIDLVYVWVNGSDILHQAARKTLLAELKYRTKDARFREHDELRYSLRAARAATKTWPNSTWHVITADVPNPHVPLESREADEEEVDILESLADSISEDDEQEAEEPEPEGENRLGLVPQWLDIECAIHGDETQPPIRLQHDTQLFRLTGSPGTKLTAKDSSEWLERILPSFNSHAIESQLPQLDPELVSENIVALNDDQFMLLPMPPAAFHTTLYGPVLRTDPGLLVGGDATGKADGGGEWRSLGWSDHLLNQRFGSRKRPYMQHNARSLSLPLMHEAALAFGEYFARTPLSQFRGSHKVPEEFEVNTIFLTGHFMVERHREALLYSWVVLKWDGYVEGMWRDLGGKDGETTIKFDDPAERTTRDDVELNLLMAGVVPPKVEDDHEQGDTTYTWTSMDGYSPRFNFLLPSVSLPRSCLERQSDSWSLFKHLLLEDPACGDQVISALIHKQRSGLGAFLPAATASSSDGDDNPETNPDPLTLPLVLTSNPPALPSNPRRFAVRLIQRYAHVLGDSPTLFVGLHSATDTQRNLRMADTTPATALFCMNDDMGNNAATLRAADKILKTWFEGRWPEKLRCEV